MTDEPAYLLWLGQLVMLSVPGYLVLQAWFAHSWPGRWRLAALVPLAGMVPALLFSLFALSQGSNLWPLAVIFLAPLGFVYLLVVWALRAIASSA
jgi:membrane-associated PAP2 superfamily phosphatase